MSRKIKRYGWIPDLPDHRDHLYAAPQPVLAKLPKKVDLYHQCPPVFNQGELGSFNANAIAAAHPFDQIKQNKPNRLGHQGVLHLSYAYLLDANLCDDFWTMKVVE